VHTHSLMATAEAPTRTLSTAEQRREELVDAAMRVFSEHGPAAPTTEIAKQAGISQAYVFRLFPTKEELFAAVTRESSRRMMTAFGAAAAKAREDGSDPLDVMGRAYDELLESERDVLMVQLYARVAASRMPLVREAIQECFKAVYELVKRESGAGRDEIHAWFAHGMLCDVTAATGIDKLDEEWARALSHSEGREDKD
jgi:AcrR family transcriptional regulator